MLIVHLLSMILSNFHHLSSLFYWCDSFETLHGYYWYNGQPIVSISQFMKMKPAYHLKYSKYSQAAYLIKFISQLGMLSRYFSWYYLFLFTIMWDAVLNCLVWLARRCGCRTERENWISCLPSRGRSYYYSVFHVQWKRIITWLTMLAHMAVLCSSMIRNLNQLLLYRWVVVRTAVQLIRLQYPTLQLSSHETVNITLIFVNETACTCSNLSIGLWSLMATAIS